MDRSGRWGWLPVLALAGCVSLERESPEQMRFLLEARRDAAPRLDAGPILTVRPFHAAHAFAGKTFVYRRAGGAVENDFYAEWLVAPAAALTELAIDWLDRCGKVQAAIPIGSRLAPTHALEADLLEISADYGSAAPSACLRVKWLLLDATHNRVLGSGTFDEREPLADREAATYAKAQQRLATRFLQALESAVPPRG